MFVRTRNGVYKQYDGTQYSADFKETLVIEQTFYGEEISTFSDDIIIDRSEKIEELADYLVMINPDKTIELYKYHGDGEWRNESGFGKLTGTSMKTLKDKDDDYEFKLAILTTKALVFVATFIGIMQDYPIEINWELEM